MRLWEDGIVAALAAIGLLTLVFLPVSAALRRRCRGIPGTLALVPCGCADGERLEQTVRALERDCRETGALRRIVILDCGMDGETRRLAELLCRDGAAVVLCPREGLGELI